LRDALNANGYENDFDAINSRKSDYLIRVLSQNCVAKNKAGQGVGRMLHGKNSSKHPEYAQQMTTIPLGKSNSRDYFNEILGSSTKEPQYSGDFSNDQYNSSNKREMQHSMPSNNYEYQSQAEARSRIRINFPNNNSNNNYHK
jgi:hypothetical protein